MLEDRAFSGSSQDVEITIQHLDSFLHPAQPKPTRRRIGSQIKSFSIINDF